MKRRSYYPISTLIAESKLEADVALLMLMEAGVQVLNVCDCVPGSQIDRVREVLGIAPQGLVPSKYTIQSLACRSQQSEEVVREILHRAKILRKRRLSRIPRAMLSDAEIALGIRLKPSTGSSMVSKSSEFFKADRLLTSRPLTDATKVERHKKSSPDWQLIGRPQELAYLSSAEVAEIHARLVNDFASSRDPIDPPGVRSIDLLESAVHRPKTCLGEADKYPSVAMAGAALVHSIVLNHPFHNGNKRAALVSLLVFLDKNSWIFTATEDEIYDFLLRLADHNLLQKDGEQVIGADPETQYCAFWINRRIRQVQRHEHPLQFRQLRQILERYQCSLANPSKGNRINITRGHLTTQIHYQDEGSDVPKETVHKVRKELELDESHGYDSGIFYVAGEHISEFINTYRQLLRKLAKV
ncbi:MAG TPA: type II toxin-antitoxin system death-on-curing family toxin [bacterium]|nr:type II toxin-antitoxin system death-on-curing family toxin [bacterium]